MNQPTFSSSTDSPADMLNNASAVVRFLADVAGAIGGDNGLPGLSDHGSFGFLLILNGIENTINEAVNRM